MAKSDQIAEIKAANQADVPDTLTVKQLDELLPLAKQGDAGRDAFDEKLTSFTDAAATAAEAEAGGQEDQRAGQ